MDKVSGRNFVLKELVCGKKVEKSNQAWQTVEPKESFFFISADLKCAISIKDLGKRVINLGGLIAWRHLSTSEIFGAILKGSFQCVLSNQSNAF